MNLVVEDEREVALGPGGALEAAVAARDEGLVRFIGVTGHGVEVAARHAASLERFVFESVLLPYSYVMMQNPQYATDCEALATTCEERRRSDAATRPRRGDVCSAGTALVSSVRVVLIDHLSGNTGQ